MRTSRSRWAMRRHGFIERRRAIALQDGVGFDAERRESRNRREVNHCLVQRGVDQPNHRRVLGVIEHRQVMVA